LVTIDDDDPEPRLEGEWKNVRENAGSVVLGLTLSEPSGRVVHGVLSPNGGSATPGEDFEQGVFPFQILPGQQVAEVEIAVVDDGTAEDTETVLLQFDALANALADSGELGFSIEDDDIVDEREEIVLRPDVGGGFSVHWRGRRGGNYAIEQSVDLRVWEAWPDFRGDATGEWQAAAIELEGVPVRFLRLSRREVDSGILTSPPQAPAGDSG
jgi:hypothetical protein